MTEPLRHSKEFRFVWMSLVQNIDRSGQGYEPWSAELEVFHNPYARHPAPHTLLPEACHLYETNGELVCSAYYETSILSSNTLIQNNSDRVPIVEDFIEVE